MPDKERVLGRWGSRSLELCLKQGTWPGAGASEEQETPSPDCVPGSGGRGGRKCRWQESTCTCPLMTDAFSTVRQAASKHLYSQLSQAEGRRASWSVAGLLTLLPLRSGGLSATPSWESSQGLGQSTSQPHLGFLPSPGIPAPLGVQRGSWEEQGKEAQRDQCRLPKDPSLAEPVKASLKSSATWGPNPLLTLRRTFPRSFLSLVSSGAGR